MQKTLYLILKSYYKDPNEVLPLAMHISNKAEQDYWLCVHNLADVNRQQYSLTLKDRCLKIYLEFCFSNYR